MASDSVQPSAEQNNESIGKKAERKPRKPKAVYDISVIKQNAIKAAISELTISRLKRAGIIEVLAVAAVMTLSVSTYSGGVWIADLSLVQIFYVITRNIIESPFNLFLSSLLFLELFTSTLTGFPIMVGLIYRRYYSPLQRTVSELTIANSDRVRSAKDHGNTHLKDVSEVFEIEKVEDEIDLRFSSFLLRSREAFDQAQRRPNALLLVGTVVAILGLAFFLVTLPGVIIKSGGDAPIQVLSTQLTAEDMSRRLLDLTPRLLMLVFIQLLAGFFLRQYRSSMEEVRYYESILRYRESQFVSYLIRKRSEDGSLKEFAQSLLENKDFIKLQQGETTLVLEAQKGEANEFKGVFETFADLLRPRKDGKDSKVSE